MAGDCFCVMMSRAFLWLAGGLGCWFITNMTGLQYLFHFFCFCRWLRENHRRSWPRFCRWQSRQCIRTKRSVWLEITLALFSLCLCPLIPLITLCMCVCCCFNVPLRSGFELRLRLLWHFKPQRLLYLFMHEVHIVLIMHSLVIAEGRLSTSPPCEHAIKWPEISHVTFQWDKSFSQSVSIMPSSWNAWIIFTQFISICMHVGCGKIQDTKLRYPQCFCAKLVFGSLRSHMERRQACFGFCLIKPITSEHMALTSICTTIAS